MTFQPMYEIIISNLWSYQTVKKGIFPLDLTKKILLTQCIYLNSLCVFALSFEKNQHSFKLGTTERGCQSYPPFKLTRLCLARNGWSLR